MLACAWISAARTGRIGVPPPLPLSCRLTSHECTDGRVITRLAVHSSAGWPCATRMYSVRSPGFAAPVLAESWDDLAAEAGDQRPRIVDHRVDVELIHAQVPQLGELGPHLLRAADHAEPVHHLVGDELGVLRSGPAVVAVVGPLAGPALVRQLAPNPGALLAL